MKTPPKISLKKVSKIKTVKTEGRRETLPVLKEIDLEIFPQEIFNIVGPSGSGKTTLLRLLNRLEEVSSGEIFLDNQELHEWNIIELRRKVGLVFQTPVLFDDTIEENLFFGKKLKEQKETIDSEKLLQLVGLDKTLLKRNAQELSLGQKQRVALARALALSPDVLLLDEPTSALDPTATLNIEKLILELQKEMGLTVIFVTHNLEQAKRLGKRSALIVQGEKIEEGDTEQLFYSPQNEITQRFVKGNL
jgi:putative ABC transport system ATP-binding protein